jgi:hypothetical protein
MAQGEHFFYFLLQCRRYKKVLKREAAAAKCALEAAIATKTSPNSKRPLSKEELQELSRRALEDTYQRIKLKKEPRDPCLKCLGRENADGNVEYKLRLKDPKEGNPYRIQQLVCQGESLISTGSGQFDVQHDIRNFSPSMLDYTDEIPNGRGEWRMLLLYWCGR